MGDERIAHAYVAAINNADVDALLALFDVNATVQNPAGTFDGVDEIRSFYESVVLAGRAQLTVRMVTIDAGAHVTAELAATSPLGEPGNELIAIDEFVLSDNGRIASLRITYR